jgi:type IV pilus assembly protein PilF
VACLSLVLALATGCVTTHHDSLQPAPVAADQPHESAEQQRIEAAQIHTDLGQRYMERGQLETALDKLKTALQFDADYAPANTVIAVLYERIGKLQLAEQYYRKAAALEPDKGAPNNNLGQFLCKLGRVDESIKYFNKAVADPFYQTPAIAYLNAGTCLIKAGRVQEAITPLRNALSLQPSNADALFQMANALTLQKVYFHARAFIQRFEALGQPNPDALLLGYRIETGLGEREVARQYAQRLRDQFPDSEQARSLNPQATP